MLQRICECGLRVTQLEGCERCQRSRKENSRLYDRRKREQSKAEFYRSGYWRKTAEAVRERARGLDEFSLFEGKIERGKVAHHIYPIDERPELRLSLDNLIYVSERTHSRIHAEYSRGMETKSRMQERLQEAILKPPGDEKK